jgi:hypothetical protein
MANIIVGSLVVGLYGLIVIILWRRHKKQKSVCARCMTQQDSPSWIQEYQNERLK